MVSPRPNPFCSANTVIFAIASSGESPLNGPEFTSLPSVCSSKAVPSFSAESSSPVRVVIQPLEGEELSAEMLITAFGIRVDGSSELFCRQFLALARPDDDAHVDIGFPAV